MIYEELKKTIDLLCQKGKGILAADESINTIGKRFLSIKLENSLKNRIKYRDLLFSTNKLEKYISGVITYEETFLNEKLIKNLKNKNILIGIKLDKGLESLIISDEKITQGLDDLNTRCNFFYKKGARFAKWRSVFEINKEKNFPSDLAIKMNCLFLARYAKICQINGLVPIVEPEVLMKGYHNREYTKIVTEKILNRLFIDLKRHKVNLNYCLLKPNMIRNGIDCKGNENYKDIAYDTSYTIFKVVPKEIPGIFFLSGGMSEILATKILNELNKSIIKSESYISFSYGRALQESVLKIWKGNDKNIIKAQNMLLKRSKANSLATYGKYLNEYQI